MSHVDDGQLHAYLDGAYPSGDQQAERIASHLESCLDCRVRLEDAREMREKAGLIMRHAAPVEMEAPSFDAILERARTRHETRRPAAVPIGSTAATAPSKHTTTRDWRRMPLAWAASLLMALAAGWLASDLFDRYGGDAPSVASAPAEADALRDEVSRDVQPEALRQLAPGGAAAAADDQAAREREQAAAGVGARSAGAVGAADADASVPNRTAVQPPATARDATVRQAVPPPANAVAEPPAGQVPARAANAAAKAAEEQRAQQRADLQTGAGRGGRQGLAPALESIEATAADSIAVIYAAADVAAATVQPPDWAMALVSRAAAASEVGRWTTVTEEEAARRLGAMPASLPDATLRSLEIDESVRGEPVVRATFDLGGGRTAELVQRAASPTVFADSGIAVDRLQQARAAAPPVAAAPPTPLRDSLERLFGDRSAIAVRRPELWILMTAPLPPDSLFALATRVR